MYFINFRKKSGFSPLIFPAILFFIALFVFGTSGSSAQTGAAFGNLKENKPFNLLDNGAPTFFGGGQIARANETEPSGLFADETSQTNIDRNVGARREKIESVKNSAVFAEFEDWIKQHNRGDFDNLRQHNELGEEIAVRRRRLLKELIELNPRAALEKAVSPEDYKNIPSSVSRHLEKRVAAYGDFSVFVIEQLGHSAGETAFSRTEREVIFGDSRYKAFVYGRRELMTTKFGIPLQGIVLDDAMAIDESFVRQPTATEYQSSRPDLNKSSESDVAAEIAGSLVYYSNQAELDRAINDEIEWESKINPVRPQGAAAPKGSAPEETASAWTTGAKKVLFIRVQFPDRLGEPTDLENEPLTITRAQNLFTDEINPFFVRNSYGKTSLSAVVTPLVSLPHTQTYYTQGDRTDELIADARAAARAAGSQYETNGNFDLDIVGFSYTRGFGWSGLSSIGGKGNLINGHFYLPQMAHELGHNYGLLHANLWRTTDKTSIGAGYNAEYEDCFDAMGASCGQNANSYFNVRYKQILDWLPEANVLTVAASGNYQIYAQDTATLNGGQLRAIKIKKDETKNYWIEFRQLIPGAAMTGALIRWDYLSKEFRETELLDMNPATSTQLDAPLQVNQAPFEDVESGIKITVTGIDNTTTPKSLKINVVIDKYANCGYSISPLNQNFPSAGGEGSINVSASAGCPLGTATSDSSWITFPYGIGVPADGTIYFSVEKNLGPQRTGMITIAGKTFTVTQATGNCGYVVNPTTFDIPSSGGTLNYTESFASGCVALKAQSTDSDWINIGTNPITVAPNSGPARSGVVKLTAIDNLTGSAVQIILTVNQAAQGNNCTYSLSTSVMSIPANGGTGSFNINSGAGCAWTATTTNSFITITGGNSGSGNGTISFSLAPNTGAARTGTITAGGRIFTINQPTGCAFSLSSPNSNFGVGGGSGTLSVVSAVGCTYTAVSNDSWIAVTSGANGSGNGTIGFSVAANTSAARTGTIAVGGQIFAVTQSAAVISTLSINNISSNEGNSGTTPFTFTVSLSAAGSQSVSVNYATADGTAIAGQDYNAANGTVTFAAGETSKTVTISVIGDNVVEPNETFSVNLSNAVNAAVSGGTGTGTILNDDSGGAAQFSALAYTVNESSGAATITVIRTGGAAEGVSVNYSTSNGTAVAGQDYTAASGTLPFAANETIKTFTVSILNDLIREPSETVNLILSNPNGVTLGNPVTAVLTITDDDSAPTLSISSISDNEGNSGTTAFNFTVSLSSVSSEVVRVDFATANGTATAPSDFQAASGSLIFSPGVTTQIISVLVNGDTQFEPSETFTVNLTNAVNASIANGQGIGTIQNDDSDAIPCAYTISPANLNVGAGASSGNTFFASASNAGCPFSATTNSSFITINSGGSNSGGGGTVGFSVTANTGAARTGTISVGGQTFTVNQAAGAIVSRKPSFDFDGDGKSDVTVFRPNNGVWYQLNSQTGFFATQFGISTDKIVPADFDGDGKTDVAVFRDGVWLLQRSSLGFASIPFGLADDIPEPADFDGDGKAELVVFRPSNGVWYSLNLVNNAFSAVQFGASEDKPVVGDYDGDGKADQAVFRPSNGVWYMLKSRDGFAAVQFGISTDKPVVGDYDGDGKADQAVFRAANGTWYIFGSAQGFSSIQWGLPTDIPAPGDFDGDGKTDVAVFRPDGGNWYQMKTTQGFGSVQFGANGDKPIPNSLIR